MSRGEIGMMWIIRKSTKGLLNQNVQERLGVVWIIGKSTKGVELGQASISVKKVVGSL